MPAHRALAIEPNSYAAFNNLGVALRASGRPGEGTRVLAQAARVDPELADRPPVPLAGRDPDCAYRGAGGVHPHRLRDEPCLLLLYFVFAIGSNVLISASPIWCCAWNAGRHRSPCLGPAARAEVRPSGVDAATGRGCVRRRRLVMAGPAHRGRSSLLALWPVPCGWSPSSHWWYWPRSRAGSTRCGRGCAGGGGRRALAHHDPGAPTLVSFRRGVGRALRRVRAGTSVGAQEGARSAQTLNSGSRSGALEASARATHTRWPGLQAELGGAAAASWTQQPRHRRGRRRP